MRYGQFERISEVAKDELQFLKPEDYITNGLDIGKLLRAEIFLKPIIEFYRLRLTSENFLEEKSKWIKSNGNQA